MNRLSPETEREKLLYEEAEARQESRKQKNVNDRKEIENGEVNRLEAFMH